MDITAIRLELATLLTTLGKPAYAYTPGNAQTPCYVVGLPDSVNPTEGSFGFMQLQLPVWACGASVYTSAGEQQVLEMALAALNKFRTVPTGATFKSLQVLNIDRVGTLTVGTAELLAAAVNLTILTTK